MSQPKHVRRLSLAQLEALAVSVEQSGARASRAGVAVVKRRAGSGRETPAAHRYDGEDVALVIWNR
jgi:hypothetical protein